MSSILKVDQLQDSGGNEIITSNGSGTITVNNQTFKNGIVMIDNWRVTSSFTGNANPIASNWERADNTIDLGKLGTGMTESSGTFTFPQTGIYYVIFMASYNLNSNSRFSSKFCISYVSVTI